MLTTRVCNYEHLAPSLFPSQFQDARKSLSAILITLLALVARRTNEERSKHDFR